MLNKIIQIYNKHGWLGLYSSLLANLAKLSPTALRLSYSEFYSPSASTLLLQKKQLQSFSYQPLISVIMPVYNPNLVFLGAAIESVLNQNYNNWELCIADDCSSDLEIRNFLKSLTEQESRIKLHFRDMNGHIAACSNSALAIAQGEYIALLDQDDLLAPHALFEVVSLLNNKPDTDIIYSNEDKLNRRGKRCQPTFKSAWSEDYFLSMMYIGHLGVYRRQLVQEVGGFRLGFEGSQDYDLALRVSEKARSIQHLPKILYHWRQHSESTSINISAKPYAYLAAKKALTESLVRRGFENAEVVDGKVLGIYHCLYPSPKNFNLIVKQLPEKDVDYTQYFSNCISEHDTETYFLFNIHNISFDNEEVIQATANQVLRPNLGLLTGKIIYNNKILSAGARLHGTELKSNFNGFSHNSSGYAARLYCHHNINVIWSDAFIISAKTLKKVLHSMPKIRDRYAYLTYMCILLNMQGYTHVYSPLINFKSSTILPSKINIDSYSQDFCNLSSGFSLINYQDNSYPSDQENKHLLFSIQI